MFTQSDIELDMATCRYYQIGLEASLTIEFANKSIFKSIIDFVIHMAYYEND